MCQRCENLKKYGQYLARLADSSSKAVAANPALASGDPTNTGNDDAATVGWLFLLLGSAITDTLADEKPATARAKIAGFTARERNDLLGAASLYHDLLGALCGLIQFVQNEQGDASEDEPDILDKLRAMLGQATAGDPADPHGVLAGVLNVPDLEDGMPPVAEIMAQLEQTGQFVMSTPTNGKTEADQRRLVERMAEALAKLSGKGVMLEMKRANTATGEIEDLAKVAFAPNTGLNSGKTDPTIH